MQWRFLLWFLTTQWRWPPDQQRFLLGWWQSVGWEEGRKRIHDWVPVSGASSVWWRNTAWSQFFSALEKQIKRSENLDDTWFVVTLVDPQYPSVLRAFEHSPTVLWSTQPWQQFPEKVLTVVGSRRSTAYGRQATQQIITECLVADPEILIVSGGAYGIDQCAHTAVLDAGGETCIVLGCGLDFIPETVQKYVGRKAMIISPFPPNDPPEKWRFPVRNHVLAQLSQAVLVVEAAEKSGSLITARIANELGKEVFVVLPPMQSPNARGAMWLLEQGATPLIDAEPILDIFGLEQLSKSDFAHKLPLEEEAVIEFLRESGGIARIGDVISGLKNNKKINSKNVRSAVFSLENKRKIEVELGVIRVSGMIQS